MLCTSTRISKLLTTFHAYIHSHRHIIISSIVNINTYRHHSLSISNDKHHRIYKKSSKSYPISTRENKAISNDIHRQNHIPNRSIRASVHHVHIRTPMTDGAEDHSLQNDDLDHCRRSHHHSRHDGDHHRNDGTKCGLSAKAWAHQRAWLDRRE